MQVVCAECHSAVTIEDVSAAVRGGSARCPRCAAEIDLQTALSEAGQVAWLVQTPDGHVGPCSAARVAAMIDKGSAGWDSLVWRVGLKDWRAARRDPELVTAVATARGGARGDTQRVAEHTSLLDPPESSQELPLLLARRIEPRVAPAQSTRRASFEPGDEQPVRAAMQGAHAPSWPPSWPAAAATKSEWRKPVQRGAGSRTPALEAGHASERRELRPAAAAGIDRGAAPAHDSGPAGPGERSEPGPVAATPEPAESRPAPEKRSSRPLLPSDAVTVADALRSAPSILATPAQLERRAPAAVQARASRPQSWLPSVQSMLLVAALAFVSGVLVAALWAHFSGQVQARISSLVAGPAIAPGAVQADVAAPLAAGLARTAPEQLELAREIARIEPELRRCVGDLSGVLDVEVYFEGASGSVGGVDLHTSRLGPSGVECATQALGRLRVAPFRGAQHRLWHRFSF